MIGFGRLYVPDQAYKDLMNIQTFQFDESSKYKAIQKGDKQEQAMFAYGQEFQIPIYYLLYNPMILPWSVTMPFYAGIEVPRTLDIGCRVLPNEKMRLAMGAVDPGLSPSYSQLVEVGGPFNQPENRGGWRLEHFVADKLLPCEEGKIVTEEDEALYAVFNRRSGPISAAMSVSIVAPDGTDWQFEK